MKINKRKIDFIYKYNKFIKKYKFLLFFRIYDKWELSKYEKIKRFLAWKIKRPYNFWRMSIHHKRISKKYLKSLDVFFKNNKGKTLGDYLIYLQNQKK